MNFRLSFEICRVCMKPDKGESMLNNIELKEKFKYTTGLKLCENDNMPSTICFKCITRLQVAHDFVQLSHKSEKNLKEFLTKIDKDFQLVTNAEKPSNEPEQGDEDLLLLMLNDGNTAEQDKKDSPPNADSKQKLEKNMDPHKTIEKNMMIALNKEEKDEIDEGPKKEMENEVGGGADQEELCEMEMVEEEGFVVYEEAALLQESENDEERENLCGETHENSQSDEEESQAEMEIIDATEIKVEVSDKRDEYLDTKLRQNENKFMYEENSMEDLNLYENTDELLPEQGQDTLENQEVNMQTEILEDAETEIEIRKCKQRPNDEKVKGDREKVQSTGRNSKSKGRKFSSNRSGGGGSGGGSGSGGKREASRKTAAISVSTRFVCVKCNRDFTTKTNLMRHMTTHEGNRPYQCNECGKSFTQNVSLKQHMYTHTGEKPYVCKFCARGFTQCKSLVFHMRRHTGEKPFPCQKCGQFFRQKDGLKIHILKHHMISEQDSETHICAICKKTLNDKYSLQVHMKKHVNNHKNLNESATSSGNSNSNEMFTEIAKDDVEFISVKPAGGEDIVLQMDDIYSSTHIVDVMATSATEPSRAKKYQCRKCFKCFAIKKSFIRHLGIHDVPLSSMYHCETCEIAFDSKYALKMHRLREHKETDINPNECEECQMEFSNAAELNEHVCVAHELFCRECQLTFKTQKQLMDHMLEHEFNEVDDV